MLHRFQRYGQGAANVLFIVNDQDAHQQTLSLSPPVGKLRVCASISVKKSEPDSIKPRLIKTEPGMGYRFESGEA